MDLHSGQTMVVAVETQVSGPDPVWQPEVVPVLCGGDHHLVIDGTRYLYVVERDQSLWSIAETCLGDGNQWTRIWELNQGRYFELVGGRLTDPDLIYPGWDLILPAEATPPADAQPKPETSPDQGSAGDGQVPPDTDGATPAPSRADPTPSTPGAAAAGPSARAAAPGVTPSVASSAGRDPDGVVGTPGPTGQAGAGSESSAAVSSGGVSGSPGGTVDSASTSTETGRAGPAGRGVGMDSGG
jgi:hypothetical protein